MAKIRDIILTSAFIFSLFPCAALEAKAGMSGSDFLTSFTDARPAALSGAFVATASGISSIFINPAGIALDVRPELSGTHTIDIYDRSTEHFSAAFPMKDFSLGFSATYNYTSDFMAIDEFGNNQGIVANYDYILCASVSEKFLGFLSGGVNFKYFGSYLYKYSKNGIAFDAGALMWYNIFRFGVSLQNLGTQSAYINVVDPMPVLLRLGLGMKIKINASDYVSAEAGTILPASSGEEKSFNFGAEYFCWDAVYLRCGANVYEESGYTLSLGAGVMLKNFVFEYTLGSINNSQKSQRLGITFIL